MKKKYITPVLKKIESIANATLGTNNQDTKDGPSNQQRYIAS